MEIDYHRQIPANVSDSSPRLDEFVNLLPEVYSIVNGIVEDCSPHSKRVGLALLAIAASSRSDNVGRYLTHMDLVRAFREWFAIAENSASSQVSKTKAHLFGLEYIKIEGGVDHIHLSYKGEEAVSLMIARATSLIGAAVGDLRPEERRILLDLAKRIIFAKGKNAFERRVAAAEP